MAHFRHTIYQVRALVDSHLCFKFFCQAVFWHHASLQCSMQRQYESTFWSSRFPSSQLAIRPVSTKWPQRCTLYVKPGPSSCENTTSIYILIFSYFQLAIDGPTVIRYAVATPVYRKNIQFRKIVLYRCFAVCLRAGLFVDLLRAVLITELTSWSETESQLEGSFFSTGQILSLFLFPGEVAFSWIDRSAHSEAKLALHWVTVPAFLEGCGPLRH